MWFSWCIGLCLYRSFKQVTGRLVLGDGVSRYLALVGLMGFFCSVYCEPRHLQVLNIKDGFFWCSIFWAEIIHQRARVYGLYGFSIKSYLLSDIQTFI